jgi:putative membrane protein
MVNETRNLARLGKVVLSRKPVLYNEIVQWTIAFAYAAMHSLRGHDGGYGPMTNVLPEQKQKHAHEGGHLALGASIEISRLINQARQEGEISEYIQIALDQNVQLLIDYIGGCERIHKTPLPFAYVVHLRRALILYCFSLPFALVESFGWGTVFATAMIAYVFFGIEEIGVEIEDPFGMDHNDLPLEQICLTIEKNLKSQMFRT